MNTTTATTVAEYQLYFLMLTYRLRNGERVLEPGALKTYADISPELLHRKMEKDKRVFQARRTQLMNSEEILHWIACTWRQIKDLYDDAGHNHAETLLASVALVVVADDIAHVSLDLTVRDEQARALGLMNFTPSEVLFELKDQEDTLQTPVQFWNFQGELPQPLKQPRLVERWQLNFSDTTYFKPIQYEENQNHPMFAMYAVTTGRMTDELFAKVQDLVWFNAQGYCTLMFLMPSLLMGHWQFAHVDAAARVIMNELDQKNSYYREFDETLLLKATVENLQLELQKIHKVIAETKYTLSRLTQAMQTLKINQHNLMVRAVEVVQPVAEKRGWTILWKTQEKVTWFESELAETTVILENCIAHHLQALEISFNYLTGQLIHLEASSLRWQSALETQRVIATEKVKSYWTIDHGDYGGCGVGSNCRCLERQFNTFSNMVAIV
ncbi:MAG: hypothetical protein R3E08_12035 [Thiotrichaceae bacterium]